MTTPPPNPPASSVEAELDRILTEFEEHCRGVYQGNVVYDKELAKSALTRLMLEARKEELETVICHKHGLGKYSCRQIRERIAQIDAEMGKLK